MNLIGEKVQIIGNHPHAEEVGTVLRVERTAIGEGLKVKLEDCECFVFNPKNLKVLQSLTKSEVGRLEDVLGI